MSTPHNQAAPREIAKTVLMPGDPLRAKFIAEHYLENVSCFNSVRNMLGYTGQYKGKTISVMGSGMGIPSIGIYSHELYAFYDVDTIIRIGTCGGISKDVKLLDLIFAQGACTDSNFASQFELPGTYSAISDFDLCLRAVQEAKKRNLRYHVGNVIASDFFYHADDNAHEKWARVGCLGVEMESYALFLNAAYHHKKAFTILTVSDHLLTHEECSARQREQGLTDMIELALEIAI